MFRVALKGVLARKGRLLLTSVAVIAGCAFLSGVFVFSDTIRASFDRLFASAYANTDAYVRSSNVIEGDFGDESRDPLDVAIVGTIAAIPGVSEAAPRVQGFAAITTADGEDLGGDGPPTFGSVFDGSASSPWTIDSGEPPSGPTDVVLAKGTAEAADPEIEIGDTVTITSRQGAQEFTVTGLALFARTDSAGGPTWALFDLPTAEQFVLGTPGKVDAVAIRGDGSMDDEELKATVAQALSGDEVEVLTGAEITDESKDAIQEGLSFFTTFLTIFAGISLFVGSFIIYNVFSISAAQRQRENALLRAIGASRRQVTRTLYVEALAVGVLGGLLGFAGGVGLAALITFVLGRVGFGLPESSLQIEPSALIITLIVGVVVTVLCAIVPAIRSGRVPPLAAMRDVSVDRSGMSRGRVITGVVFAALAALGIALGLTSDPVWLALGVTSLFVALVALGPVIAAPLARLLTKPLGAVRGVTGEIAGRNAATSPKRTALTAAALGIGLSLLVAVSTLGASVKESIRETLGEGFRGDFAVGAEGGGHDDFGGLPISLADELNQLPEVGDAVGLGGTLVDVDTGAGPKGGTVVTVDPERAPALVDLAFVAGGWGDLDASSILVSKDKAERDDLAVGSTVGVRLLDRTSKELTVVGIYDDDLFGNLIVSRALFADSSQPLFDFQVLVQSAPGVSEGAAQAAIQTVVDRYPTSQVQTRSEFIDSQSAQVDSFLNFIYALLAMSIFIAVLGIVITLLLAVYERRRELGLVRAIGMTRAQVRSSVRWEAALTAVLGAMMGVVLGVALGWIVVTALKDEGLSTFSVSPTSIVVFALVAVVVAVIAAWIPARRAARSDILQAIATT